MPLGACLLLCSQHVDLVDSAQTRRVLAQPYAHAAPAQAAKAKAKAEQAFSQPRSSFAFMIPSQDIPTTEFVCSSCTQLQAQACKRGYITL